MHPSDHASGVYSQSEREIFPYFNGQKNVWGDPIRIKRRLYNALGGDLNKALAEAHGPVTQDADRAHERVLAATIYAFELVPFDPESGAGAMEAEVIQALSSFLKWLEKKSPNTGNSLTSAQPSDSPPAHSPTTPTSG